MTIRRALSGLAFALVLTGAGAVHAQDRSHVLQDGRTIIIPSQTVACSVPETSPDPRFAIALALECRDTITGVGGTGHVLVGREGGETTPREYLASLAAEMFPDATPAEQMAQIQTVQTEFSGATFEMLCVTGRSEEGTFGEVTCVLSQPRTQVILYGRSEGLEQAIGVIVMFLSGVSIRGTV